MADYFNRFIKDATANTEALNNDGGEMSTNDDQEARIAKLREEIKKLGGNEMKVEDLPADVEEEFLRHVLEYETAEPISLFKILENGGLFLPAPSDPFYADDDALAARLKEVIAAMANVGAYLLHTDHLSDRQLYEYLYNEGLREEAVLFPENASYSYMIDLTGSGTEEDNQTYLKYYADAEHRKQWAQDWPDDPMPERELPPFDRDKHLPVAPLGR